MPSGIQISATIPHRDGLTPLRVGVMIITHNSYREDDMNAIADAIREVTAIAQNNYDDGKCSSSVDLFDVIELLLSIAERIENKEIISK